VGFGFRFSGKLVTVVGILYMTQWKAGSWPFTLLSSVRRTYERVPGGPLDQVSGGDIFAPFWEYLSSNWSPDPKTVDVTINLPPARALTISFASTGGPLFS